MASGSVFKQPLLWFLVIGLLLFIADNQFSVGRNEIIISPVLRERLATLWTTQTGLVATEAELDALVENWLQEEVMYQEALRLGLDRDDSIVRRRLVQKLGFIAESEDSPEPEPSELLAFYQEHLADYTLPIRYSFQQLYFQSMDQAENALDQISNGAEASALGQLSMLNSGYAYRSELDLNATFGAGFASQLAGLQPGSWQGPVQSSFGFHLILVNAIHPSEISPLQAVQEQVTQDFKRSRQSHARDAYIEKLLDEYTIIVEAR